MLPGFEAGSAKVQLQSTCCSGQGAEPSKGSTERVQVFFVLAGTEASVKLTEPFPSTQLSSRSLCGVQPPQNKQRVKEKLEFIRSHSLKGVTGTEQTCLDQSLHLVFGSSNTPPGWEAFQAT